MKNLYIGRASLLLIALVSYNILNAIVISEVGINIFEPLTHTWQGRMLLADFVIAMVLTITWLWHDGKANNRNVWLWIALTLLTAWTAPLLYLLLYKTRK
jgi:hypothetical protein